MRWSRTKQPLLRPTAVGRLTAWYAVLFALAAAAMAIGSYALVSRTFAEAPARSATVFADLGLDTPDAQALEQFREVLGVDPQEVAATAVSRARRQVLGELALRSAVALLITLVVSVVGAWWLARRAFRPVRRLTTLANGMSATNLHDRIDLQGPDDELKALADTFDGMLARLEQAFVAQRLFAAHVSHELRTPLSTLRAESDMVAAATDATDRERRLAAVAQAAVERSDRLIASLLALSRAESGTANREPIDLAELVGDVVGDLIAEANAHDVEIVLSLDDAHVRGDRPLMRSLVENLVRNAIIYNRAGGEVAVGVRTVGDGATLRVENSGRVLTAAEVQAMTRPFSRGQTADSSVPGAGIGTAVVRAVASAHDGRFTASARAGGGLVAVVDLPAEPAPAGPV
jgi:signal transduction histidine kinase